MSESQSEISDEWDILDDVEQRTYTPRQRGRRRNRMRNRGRKNWEDKKTNATINNVVSLVNANGQVDDRQIENLLNENPKTILDRLLDSSSGFKEILRLECVQDTIILIIAVINKAFETTKCEQAVNELREILIGSNLFSKHLPELLKRKKANVSILLKQFEILNLLRNVLPILQNSSKSSVQSFILLFYLIKENVSNSNDQCTFQELESFEEKLDIELMKRDEMNINKTQSEFINFRKIPIMPSREELFSSQDTYLPSIIERGSYNTLDYYLAVHFRLMREDFTSSLRSAFKEYQKKISEQHQTKYAEANFYENVQIRLAFVRGEEFFKLTFNSLTKNNSDTTDRLKYGNLLCISSNRFSTMYFGLIQTYEEDELPYNETLIQVTSKKMKDNLEKEVLNKPTYVVMESPAYFEAYRHVLSCLQIIKQNQLPFEKHIVHVDPHVKAPAYLKSNAIIELSLLNNQKKLVPAFDINTWPTADDLSLDKSQVHALHLALSHSLAIIQGPPGTGKTYIGLQILKTLSSNKHNWNLQRSPILIVCYTNHALDQFLEEILEFNQNLVRVGGRSVSTKLQEYNLKYIKENEESYMQLMKEINGLKMQAEKIEQITKHKTKKIFHECMLDLSEPDERLLNQLKDKSENFETKSSLASWLQITFNKEELTQLGVSHYIYGFSKQVTFNIFDKHKGTDINFLAIMRCHFNFPDDLKRTLLRKLKQPCALKKDLAMEELKKADFMSEQEVKTVNDIWKLSLNDRWRLYRRWLKEVTENAKDKMHFLQKTIALKTEAMRKISNKLTFDILRTSEVIGMTTSGAARYYNMLKRLSCEIVIVEEAAEVFESHIIASLNPKTKHLILIGDHQQLKPKPAEYRLAKEYKLDLSLFERLINNNLPYVTLEQQHRMRPQISSIIRKHFYPNLRDDPRVLKYPNIRGVNNNVYFINHSNFEELVTEDSVTYKNEFEAKFMLSFCEYLIQQGYEENCITILTTYSGQLATMKSLLKEYPSLSQKLRISTVDNYQGEENDIILLSLVRSNYDDRIGFLKESNRINVALTRARHGLFVIGNFKLLALESDLWKSIVLDLIKSGQLGNSLPIVCENHKNNVREIEKGEDFKALAPHGRCTKPCGFKLPCSHECKENCWHTGNHSCTMNVTKSLDCGHKISAKCSGLELTSKTLQKYCNQMCGKKLECGHLCQLICHNDYKHNCMETKKQLLSCRRHSKNFVCSMKSNPFNEIKFICEEECGKLMSCGHQCSLQCHSHYDHECNKFLKKILPCGHNLIQKCTGAALYNTARISSPCLKKCEAILPCGHICAQICHPYTKHDCKMEVMKLLRCGHQIKLPCLTDPRSYSCQEIVRRYFSCGKHTIPTKCSEDLSNVSCNTCAKKNSKCAIS